MSFWAEAAKEIDWIKPPKTVFDPQAGVYGRWFPDGTLNTCYNALDRHVINGRADQAALIYDSPVAGLQRTYTYAQLLAEVNAVASVLKDFGVGKGDRVLVYMPMIAEAVIGVLACARIGAVHSVVFGGFASKELATRIDDSQPKVILTASCGIETSRIIKYKPLLDEAIELAAVKPEKVLLIQRPQEQATHDPRARFRLGRVWSSRRWRNAARSSRKKCWRPTRFTSSIPRARRAFPRAWCATMAAMRSRSSGR